jgi:hypothetical protein
MGRKATNISPAADAPALSLADLTPDPKNARKHSPRNVGTIVDALHEVGAARSIVIDEDGVILAGNATCEAAAEAGITKVQVVEADGNTIVAVRRTGLTPEQKAKLALYDNRAAELADGWDAGVLKELATEIDLSKMFSADELAELLGDEPAGGLTDPDAVPEERPTDIKPGDLFELGEHRLLCGDSTKAEDVARVMGGERAAVVITDPPYNVGFDYGKNVDDEKSAAEYLAWTRRWFVLAKAQTASCVVLTTGITNLPMWIADVERTHRILAWVKENQCSRNDIGTTSGFNTWEPILVYGKAKKCVARDSFSIPISIQADAEGHPCPKSLKAWEWLLDNFSDKGDVLYEPFSGSGTTLIACEQLGRKCRAMEIEPRYCDVAIRRWEEFTGKKAVRVA